MRPEGDPGYGAGDGSSYADAWNGTKKIIFGPDGVEAGDNLYICGVHLLKTTKPYTSEGLVTVSESGFSDEYPITIRMDCPGDEGLFWGYFLDETDLWTHVANGVYRTNSLNRNFFSGGLMQDIDGRSGTLLARVRADTCSATEVEEAWKDTPGVWCWTGSTAYLKTTDGLDPTGRIYESRWGYWIDMGWSDHIKFYKCNFYGSKPYNKYPYYVDKELETVSDELPSTDITFDSTKIRYLPGKMISPLLLNDRWTVRNCELSEGANAVYSIAFTVKYAHLSPNKLTVENNYIHDIGDTGDGNFYDGDSHAVGIQGGSDHLIQNNVIEKTGSSIVLFSNPGQIMRDNIIRNNVLIDIYAQASYGGVAIALSGFTEAPLGERTGNKFYNNIVLGAQGSGMTSNAPDLVQIYNNLFYNIDKAGFAAFSKSGSKYLGRNNMFVDVEDYYLSINYETIPGEPFLEWDHNLYFNDTPKDTYAFYYLPTGRKYLTSWIEDPPYDDPYLETPEDPSTEILDEPYFHISEQMVRLAENSPAIDAGFDMQRESDVYGNPIYGRPDIGPVEYQPGHVMGEPWVLKPRCTPTENSGLRQMPFKPILL